MSEMPRSTIPNLPSPAASTAEVVPEWRSSVLQFARVFTGVLVLWLVTVQSARSQEAPHIMRIGLQTRQTEVRLSAPMSIRLDAAGTKLLAIPAEQVVVFHPKDNGVVVLDANCKELVTATGRIQVAADTEAPAPEAPPVIPLIRLLGPTRHPDHKPDRPYRGEMEIVPANGGLTVVNVVDVESYLLGVVSSEMGPTFPLEALKAQAVAARTYALKNIGRFSALGYDLDDTNLSQVYGGYISEDPHTTQAVQETANQVMTYNGNLIDAVYSSTCGGYTESAEEAWGHAVPYLTSVADYDDEVLPGGHPASEEDWAAYFKTARALHCLQPKYARVEAFRWVKLVTRKELEAALPADTQVGTVQNIVPLHRGQSGRIYSLRLEGTNRSVQLDNESSIRKTIGNLRTSAFTVDIYRDDAGIPVVFAFWGAGWGHGLGMCQVGAVGLALEECSYEKILTYYYHGVTIEKR